MPVKNYDKLAIHVEPELHDQLKDLMKSSGINRTKLLRMMIKYCINPYIASQVIAQGDPPVQPIQPSQPLPRKKSK